MRKKLAYFSYALLCGNILVYIATDSLKLTILIWLGLSLIWSLWSILLNRIIQVDFKLLNRYELERIRRNTIPFEVSKIGDQFLILLKLTYKLGIPLIVFFIICWGLNGISPTPITNLTVTIFGKETKARVIESDDYFESSDRGGTVREYGKLKYKVKEKSYEVFLHGYFEKGKNVNIQYLPVNPQTIRAWNESDGYLQNFGRNLIASIFIILISAFTPVFSTPKLVSIDNHI